MIKRWLTYTDKRNGMFIWKRSPNQRRIQAGDVAGTITTKGVTITLQGKRYTAAGLSWVLAYGEQPPRRMVYRDGDCFNITPENLKAFEPLSEEELKLRKAERARLKREQRWSYIGSAYSHLSPL